ncbi:MAG TPA: ABC transporter permease [Methanomassiliicoccales archaeon]|jgi:peptide/nickel transport system permease protein
MAENDRIGLNDRIGKSIQGLKKAMRPRVREFRQSMFMFRRSPLAMVGLGIILAIILMAVFAPVLAPPYNERDPLTMPMTGFDPAPPGIPGHPLGLGKNGVDLYYGIVWGARTSVYTALFVVGVAAIIGVVLGAVAGYYGGRVDEVLMRITDVFLSIPGLILTMAVVAVLSHSSITYQESLNNIMLSLIITWWPSYARLIRGQVLSIKESTYVEAARAIGAKKNRILFRHVVPNSLSPMFVAATMDMGTVVLVAAALSFIGFGPPSGTAEWGKMVADGQSFFIGQPVLYNGEVIHPWWVATFPGIAIFLFVIGFNLLGDGLRDIMDPRLRR